LTDIVTITMLQSMLLAAALLPSGRLGGFRTQAGSRTTTRAAGSTASSTASSTTLAARSELDCEHFSACSGCVLEDGLSEPPLLGSARAFFATHGVNVTVVSGNPHGWRTHAKLAVRAAESGAALLGLFSRGSHQVVPVPRCRVHHPAINEALAALEAELQLPDAVSAYSETQSSGTLRYVQLSVERSTERVQAESALPMESALPTALAHLSHPADGSCPFVTPEMFRWMLAPMIPRPRVLPESDRAADGTLEDCGSSVLFGCSLLTSS
jgi:hypothetical protein